MSQTGRLTVLHIWSGETVCASCLYEGSVFYIIIPSSLKKRGNSVGSVVSVGKSERSPETILLKVFQNAYTDYTTYIGRGLELHHWMDTVPLHTAGGPRLVDVSEFVQGFLERIALRHRYLIICILARE